MISEQLRSSGVACDPCIAERMMHKWKRCNRSEEHSCVELWEEAAAALPEHRPTLPRNSLWEYSSERRWGLCYYRKVLCGEIWTPSFSSEWEGVISQQVTLSVSVFMAFLLLSILLNPQFCHSSHWTNKGVPWGLFDFPEMNLFWGVKCKARATR